MASCTVHLICSQKPVLWPVQAAHELTLQSDVWIAASVVEFRWTGKRTKERLCLPNAFILSLSSKVKWKKRRGKQQLCFWTMSQLPQAATNHNVISPRSCNDCFLHLVTHALDQVFVWRQLTKCRLAVNAAWWPKETWRETMICNFGTVLKPDAFECCESKLHALEWSKNECNVEERFGQRPLKHFSLAPEWTILLREKSLWAHWTTAVLSTSHALSLWPLIPLPILREWLASARLGVLGSSQWVPWDWIPNWSHEF